MWNEDAPREACGLFGIYAPGEDVARLTYFGLFALQHRGQESAGIAVSDGRCIRAYKDLGLVTRVFSEPVLQSLQGDIAVGHTRYSTTGSSTLRVVQKRTVQESIALLQEDEDTIRVLAQNQQLSEPIRQALNSILNRRRAIRNIEAQIRQQEARIKSITDDQARIRENMRALDRNSDLYRQYVQKLAQQEREIEQARAEIERLQEQRARAQRELSDYIAGLNL